MFCLKCGAIIQAGATSCPRCHAPVEAKKTDNFNSFKDYSKGDYRSDDFGKSYSADDYRQKQDAPNTKQDESPRFQLKKDSSFNLNSSDSSKFQIKSEGFSLRLSHQPDPPDTPAPKTPEPLAPVPEQPTYSQPTPAQQPVQPPPATVQPPPATYVRPTYSSPNQPTQQPYAQPDSVPTWKEDSPDAPPTPLAAAPQSYQQPDNGASSSSGTLPPLYGQSNFGTYQPDTPREPVNDHLGLSIFTTLCCCQLGGVIAIVFSVKARNAVQRGDYDSARSSAKAALWISLISILLTILFWFGGTLLEAANTDSYDEDSGDEQEQYLNIEPDAQEEGAAPKAKLNIDPKDRL